jgi:hypothetical protein
MTAQSVLNCHNLLWCIVDDIERGGHTLPEIQVDRLRGKRGGDWNWAHGRCMLERLCFIEKRDACVVQVMAGKIQLHLLLV